MNMNRNVSSDWIKKIESLEHWISYWYQAKLMEDYIKPGDKIVEMGPGTGFLANYLRHKGARVITIDVDRAKRPDIVVDGTNFYPRKPFHFFCAFEVFEHLKFEEMGEVLDNIEHSVRGGIFLSLPVFKKTPFVVVSRLLQSYKTFALHTKKHKITENHHCWELGFEDYSENRVMQEFEMRNYKLKKKLKFSRWRYFYFVKKEPDAYLLSSPRTQKAIA